MHVPNTESIFPTLTGRKHPRTSCQKTATIVLTPELPVIRCTVTDISKSGAGLSLSIGSTFGIPDTFDLIFDGDPKKYACRVAWKQLHKMGVAFQ